MTDALRALADAGMAWATLPAAARAAVATRCRDALAAAADTWVQVSLAAKGWQALPAAHAEEWASGPLPVARLLHLYAQLHTFFGPAPAAGQRRRCAPVPGLADALLLAGYRADLVGGTTAGERTPPGGLTVVLGAGNVTATPVLDALHHVFVLRSAVVLKLSPLHTALQPVFARVLAPLCDRGVLQVVTGDATAARALTHDPAVTAVHLTGSGATWRALRNDPALAHKRLTAEVGCVSPAFVVPGRWRDRELTFVARHLAALVATNGGATCLAPRVVLTATGWPQRERFVARLRGALAALPARVPFHPAAAGAYERSLGAPPGVALQPVLRAPLDAVTDAAWLQEEHFAPVLGELPVTADTAATFLPRAVDAASRLHGALSATFWAPPRVLAAARTHVDTAVAQLQHFTVAINTWAGIGYGLGTTPWGVRAGAPIDHGRGQVHGTSGEHEVHQVVLDAPFRPRPLPPWLPWHRAGAATLRALTRFYLRPGPLRLANVIARAMLSP